VATQFFEDWKTDKYPDMYGLLTSVGKDAVTQDVFVKRFTDIAVGLTLQELDYEILTAIYQSQHGPGVVPPDL